MPTSDHRNRPDAARHTVVGMMSEWLIPTSHDRERFQEMTGRVVRARRIQGISVGTASAVSAHWYGWPLLALVVVAAVILGALERGRRRWPPEFLSATGMLALELVVVGAVSVSGGAYSPILPSAAIPIIMLGARFRPTVVTLGLALSMVMTAAGVGLAALLPDPPQIPAALHIVWYLVMLASVVAATSSLLSSDISFRNQAQRDPLTGLLNRTALQGYLRQTLGECGDHRPVCVLLVDVDHFKRVNDTRGHAAGDVVLREVADRLQSFLRDDDEVFRYGGEEFVLVVHTDPEQVPGVADRLLDAIRSTPIAGLEVTISVGLVQVEATQTDPQVLIGWADEAMYAAKQSGRDQAWLNIPDDGSGRRLLPCA